MSDPRPAPQVTCPVCGRRAPYSPDNPWRPFCSERCRLVDLGQWASEGYRIPARDGQPGADEADD